MPSHGGKKAPLQRTGGLIIAILVDTWQRSKGMVQKRKLGNSAARKGPNRHLAWLNDPAKDAARERIRALFRDLRVVSSNWHTLSKDAAIQRIPALSGGWSFVSGSWHPDFDPHTRADFGEFRGDRGPLPAHQNELWRLSADTSFRRRPLSLVDCFLCGSPIQARMVGIAGHGHRTAMLGRCSISLESWARCPPHYGVQLRKMVLREIRAPKILQLEVQREGVSVNPGVERISTRQGSGVLLAAQEQECEVKGRVKRWRSISAAEIYWYKFNFDGEAIRESTRQTNQHTARQMEAAHRTSLAKGEVGIRERKVVPTLAEFISERFEPWAEASTAPKTWLDYYRPGIRTLLRYMPLAGLRLDEITSEKAADFAAWRQSAGLQVSSINSVLQVLRRITRLAVQWGAIEAAPSIKMIPGERHREHVVKFDEEARYLGVAAEPLASVTAVLIDTGMRPDECYRLRWESVTWTNGRNGTILVTHGKTSAARRVLPLSIRVRNILHDRWETAGSPIEGWVWTAPTLS